MNKKILTCCVALIALSGCANQECQDELCSDDQLSTQENALKTRNFGVENGGEPYTNDQIQLLTAHSPERLSYFGRTLAVADIDGDSKPDIVTSHSGRTKHGQIEVFYGGENYAASHVIDRVQGDSTSTDGFAYNLTAGQFCPSLTPYDVIIAPALNVGAQAESQIALIYRTADNKEVKVQKLLTIKDSSALNAGYNALVADDLDNDGKIDLVYGANPAKADNANDFEKARVHFISDICSQTGTIDQGTTILEAENTVFNPGYALYTADLNNNGSKELVIVDNAYTDGNVDAYNTGAVYFYKHNGSAFVQSRKPLYGKYTSGDTTRGTQIESVAFADVTGDGKLDLIVGEPAYWGSAKNEGRVRTYTNTGADFDASEMVWSASSGRSYANFGKSVAVADINSDGVSDLIVGAPGMRDSGGNKAQAYAYVYLGTKDGSHFSEKPYWTYKSDVATALNDSFAAKSAVADIDNKGWKDLIFTASYYSPDDNEHKNQGRIHIFKQSVAPCYTADKCLDPESNTCYTNGETAPENKCMVCDPTRDNFGFVERVCDTGESECLESATCSPAKGCVVTPKADGTACGVNTCSGNQLVVQSCKSGKCQAQSPTSCPAGSVCDDGVCNGSKACQSDADCGDTQLACRVNVCVENQRPVITFGATSLTLRQGESRLLPVSVADPDDDAFSVLWSDRKPGIASTYLDSKTTAAPTITIPEDAQITTTPHTLIIKATDSHGLSASRTLPIHIIEKSDPFLSIDDPANNSTVRYNDVTFSGSAANVSGTVNVTTVSRTLCSAIISDQKWSCTASALRSGSYSVRAVMNDNAAIASETIAFTIKPYPTPAFNFPQDGMVLGIGNALFMGHKAEPGVEVVVTATNEKGSRTCTSTATETGSWGCNIALPDDDYSVVAAYTIDGKTYSSETITITISNDDKPIGDISITTPQTGETLTTSDVVFAGVTAPEREVILIATHEDETAYYCDAVADATGTWTCTATLPNGTFQAVANYKIDATTYSSTPVVFTVNTKGSENFEITSPKEGEIVVDSLQITGIAKNADNQTVSVSIDDTPFCSAVVSNEEWKCDAADLEPGRYVLRATLDASDDSASTAFTFIFSPPVVTAPKPNDTVPVLPTFEGTSNHRNGFITVWRFNDNNSLSPICSVDITAESWKCTAENPLDFDTEYRIRVTWTPENHPDILVAAEPDFSIETEVDPSIAISFLTPAQDTTLDTSSVIFSGLATPNAEIVVINTKNDTQLCVAHANLNGRWACSDVTLPNGDYFVYAQTNDRTPVRSDILSFSIHTPNLPEDNAFSTSGGSCAIAPKSNTSPWLLLIATGALLCLRRRRFN